MTSELVSQLTALLDRWENLSAAASQRVDTSVQPIQGSFYAGVLFGMGIARDELALELANAMAEEAKLSAGMIDSVRQLRN